MLGWLTWLTWLLVSLHMWLWQALWIRSGTLANNCWLRLDYVVLVGTLEEPLQTRTNNFTIPLMEVLWLLCSLALLAAALRTSLPYEVFQYTHFLMILFFLMSFLHAFQSWYFTGGGLLLYLYDKCMRLLQSARLAHTDSLEFLEDAGLTRVVLSKEQFGRPYQAGQYCWLNLPAVSPLEWHPFTVSSAPHMDSAEFTVQNRGSREWTGRLAALALTRPVDLQVLVDGPYGRHVPYADYHTVMLIGTCLLSLMMSAEAC